MKNLKRMAITLLFMAAVFIGAPQTASAAQSATNMTDLARIVSQHAMNRERSFSVRYTGNKADINKLVRDDTLEFFYSTMALLDDPATSDDADYIIGNIDYTARDFDIRMNGEMVEFTLGYFETLTQTKYVNSNVPQILSSLGVSSMSNYDKVKTIHDYVCRLITYDDRNAETDDSLSTMYGALANHRAICNSYALCMYKLLVEAGVPCKYIGGVAGSGRDSGGHAWNIVALGDKWYNIDVTWDDTLEEPRVVYDYFLKGRSDFDSAEPSERHKMDDPYYKTAFASAFPIADRAFDPSSMSDVNNVIKVGTTGYSVNTKDDGKNNNDKKDDDKKDDNTKDNNKDKDTKDTEKYSLSDITEGTYPEDGRFSVWKGRKEELQLFIRADMGDLVKSVSYEVVKGKDCVKKVKNHGIFEDEEGYFTSLTFKGNKAGKVKIKVILNLTNGQKLSYTFKGNVR